MASLASPMVPPTPVVSAALVIEPRATGLDILGPSLEDLPIDVLSGEPAVRVHIDDDQPPLIGLHEIGQLAVAVLVVDIALFKRLWAIEQTPETVCPGGKEAARG